VKSKIKYKIDVVTYQKCDTMNVEVAQFGANAMSKLPVIAALCSALLLSGNAWAATVEPGQGNLSIDQGQGFKPVNSRIDAKVGDSVMVAPGGAATVVYDDGCQVDVGPSAVTTIAPLSPCASGSYAQDNTDTTTGLVVGAGVLGVGGFIGYEASKSTNNSSAPASP
jgi:hypothetical protein